VSVLSARVTESPLADRVRAWWNTPARALHAYAIAAGIGIVVYMVVYGPSHALGTSSYWDLPQEDSRAYLMGYRYFLHEPWHWPIFTSHTINVPFTKSLAFSDGIPVWALVNKSIATIVPPWGPFSSRAYLGLWHLLRYILQPCLGVAIMRQLDQRSRGAAFLTAIFFIAVPSWIVRYGHAALSAHWLILWPIYMYLRTPANALPPTRLQVMWLCELAIAALTNPYHVMMSFGLFCGSLGKSFRLRALVWLPAAIATVGVMAWSAGYLARAATVPMFGFDSASTNMLSMFVPERSGIFGDARGWLANTNATDYQYEGFIYLGLGYLILFALFLRHARTLGGVIKRHRFLFAVALGFWLFALSNHVYFGSHLIL